jgi:hypothetical protein
MNRAPWCSTSLKARSSDVLAIAQLDAYWCAASPSSAGPGSRRRCRAVDCGGCADRDRRRTLHRRLRRMVRDGRRSLRVALSQRRSVARDRNARSARSRRCRRFGNAREGNADETVNSAVNVQPDRGHGASEAGSAVLLNAPLSKRNILLDEAPDDYVHFAVPCRSASFKCRSFNRHCDPCSRLSPRRNPHVRTRPSQLLFRSCFFKASSVWLRCADRTTPWTQ